MTERMIFVNEDDAHFCACHPAEDMTAAGLERLVDYYVEDSAVAGVLFCPNLQKALYDSAVWERLYDGYDPTGGPDQPFLSLLASQYRDIVSGDHARNWVHNQWLLDCHHKVDRFAVWLARCRHHGVEGWLTVRMNDCHGLQEYQQRIDGDGDYEGWALLCPSTFWRENPQFRRAPYRWERSWESAYNYLEKAVRTHYLALLEELLGRFDMTGLELDWLRWGLNFPPGFEQQGRQVLTEFMADVRRLVDAAAKRLGHPVKLGVRVPAELQACLDLGYDVLAWAERGFCDQFVLSGNGNVANFNYSIDLWRAIVGDVRLLTLVEPVAQPYAAFPGPISHDSLLCGAAASALHRGVDGLYLFNICYRETEEPGRSVLKQLLSSLPDATRERRHAVTYPQFYAAGSGSGEVLPIALKPSAIGGDMGRMERNITLRIPIGRAPSTGRAVLILCFSPDVPSWQPETLDVRVNGQLCEPCVADEPVSAIAVNNVEWAAAETQAAIGLTLRFDIPLSALHDDQNVVEFEPPEMDGELRWSEIWLSP